MTDVLLKSTATWPAFIPIAIINGLFREKFLVQLFGIRRALPLSGFSCAILFFLLVYISLPWLGSLTLRQSLLIGLSWLVMTIQFELLFGRIITRRPWMDLLQAYNLLTGNLRILVLLIVAISPFLVTKLRGVAA